MFEMAMRLIYAFVFAFSVMRIIIPMSSPNTSALTDFIATLVILSAIALMTWGRWNLLASTIILVICIVFFIIHVYVNQASNFIDFFSSYFRELAQELGADMESEAIMNENVALIITQNLLRLFIVIFSYITIARFRLPIPMAIVLVFLVPISFKSPNPINLSWLIPASIALLLSAFFDSQFFYTINKRNHKLNLSGKRAGLNLFQLILPIAIATLLAISLIPFINHNEIFSPFLQGIVDDLSNSLPRSFDNQLKLSNMNLSSAGYYNQSGYLGGPVELNDSLVFKYKGGDSNGIYLAASKYVDYDLNRWLISSTTDYYRFGSPFKRAEEEKNTIFKVELPAKSILEGLDNSYPLLNYSIIPLSEKQQSILLAGNVETLSIPRVASRLFYYNAAGNLYAGSPLDTGVPYELTVQQIPVIDSQSQDSNSLYNRLADNSAMLNEFSDESSSKEYAERFFLSLPSRSFYSPNGYLQQLAQNISSNAQNDYERVIALKNWLTSSDFTYSLNVNPLAQGEDIVSKLLEDKVGYCVYYASAMTLMARELGIPARYVEGYKIDNSIPKDEDGNLIVSERYAHAWTEVYIDGLNWLVIDATPGDGESDQSVDESESQSSTRNTQNIRNTTSTQRSSSETSSSQTTAKQNPNNNDNNKNTLANILRWFLYLLLIILLLALLLYWRYLSAKREIDLSRDKNRMYKISAGDGRVLLPYYWYEIRKLLHICPVNRDTSKGIKLSNKFAKSQSTYDKSSQNIEPDLAPVKGFASEFNELFEYYSSILNSQELNVLKKIVSNIERIYYSQHSIDSELIDECISFYIHLDDSIKANIPMHLYFIKRMIPMKSVRSGLKKSKELLLKNKIEI